MYIAALFVSIKVFHLVMISGVHRFTHIWWSNVTLHLESHKYSRNLVYDNFWHFFDRQTNTPTNRPTDRPAEPRCRSSKWSFKKLFLAMYQINHIKRSGWIDNFFCFLVHPSVWKAHSSVFSAPCIIFLCVPTKIKTKRGFRVSIPPNSKHTRVDREVNHGVRGISIVVSKFCPELSSLPFIQLASHLRYLSVVFHSTGKFSFMINSISLWVFWNLSMYDFIC